MRSILAARPLARTRYRTSTNCADMGWKLCSPSCSLRSTQCLVRRCFAFGNFRQLDTAARILRQMISINAKKDGPTFLADPSRQWLSRRPVGQRLAHGSDNLATDSREVTPRQRGRQVSLIAVSGVEWTR